MRDGEDADAALGAAGLADEVVATASVRVGYCGVYDLNEFWVGHTDIRGVVDQRR
jgi:hypothetical protein